MQKQLEQIAEHLALEMKNQIDSMAAMFNKANSELLDKLEALENQLACAKGELEDTKKSLAEVVKKDDETKQEPDLIDLLAGALKGAGNEFSEAIKAMVESVEVPQPENGRDALELEILPSIDESKSYPRGTYATHSGGLFRAYQKTSGMHGWECIVNGVDSLSMDFDSANKGFTITALMSNGDSVDKTVCIPMNEYKGVYRDSEQYLKGDSATYDGSVWIALEDSPEGMPSISKGWQLAVKRGGTGRGLLAIAKANGFKGTEKDLLDKALFGREPNNIVRLSDGD